MGQRNDADELSELSNTKTTDSDRKKDKQFETAEEDAVRTRNRLDKQTLCLRWAASVVALVVLIGLAWLECHVFYYITKEDHSGGEMFVILAVAPIAAITAILIAALIGVFRGYRRNEWDSSIPAIGKLAGSNGL